LSAEADVQGAVAIGEVAAAAAAASAGAEDVRAAGGPARDSHSKGSEAAAAAGQGPSLEQQQCWRQ
jgi:hypothetical protein